jgi:hypothetical protein
MAEVRSSDSFAQVRGFRVELRDSSGGKEVDTAWESVFGGELIVESYEHSDEQGACKTAGSGLKTVGELVLRGPMTAGRLALCQWINDTVNGRGFKRTLTITELLSSGGGVKSGRQYVYHDCFPVGYVFPRLSVTNTTGNVLEEVRIRCGRVELK